MAIKISNSTIIDDSRVITNASTVLVGTASSTGTASQPLQVTGGAYVSGNLGIGTTNPTSKLYVVGDTYVTGILTANRLFSGLYGEFVGGSISGSNIVGTSLSITGISTFTNGPVLIGSGTSTGTASQRLEVTGGAYVSGNLGIGTTNPLGNLHVVDTVVVAQAGAGSSYVRLKGYSTQSGAISFESSDGGTQYYSVTGDTSTLFAVNDSSANAKLTVTSAGNLGIGTTNPTSKLYVVGDTYVTGILTANRLFSGLYGEFVGGSISGSNIVGTSLSITGISTFTNGPVLIGSGTSTGTASQRLQVTGGAYVSGNLGIGTTNPLGNLHVVDTVVVAQAGAGSSYVRLKGYSTQSGAISFESSDGGTQYYSITGDTSTLFAVNDSSANPKLTVSSAGNVGIGTTNPTSLFHLNGTFKFTSRGTPSTQTALHVNTTTGDVIETASSRRFKRDIVDYNKGLETVLQLRPVSFKFLEEDRINAGLIAEEVADLGLEEFVIREEDGTPRSIPYDNLIALLINAIKDLKTEINNINN